MKQRARQAVAELRAGQKAAQPPAPVRPSRDQLDWDSLEPYLKMLPEKYQEAISSQRDGMSCREAGEQSRRPCSEGAMKVRRFRARQELRRLVKAGEGEESDDS